MKLVRLLALAGTLGMIFPLGALASEHNARPEKKNVSVVDKVEIAGKTLQPGRYAVEWRGSGPMVKVNFMRYGKTIVTAPARVTQLKTASPYDAVVEKTETNGTKTISQIEWNNQREALTFGRQATTGHSRHTKRSAS